MKFTFTLLTLFCLFTLSYAEQVDSVRAKKVAIQFFNKVKPSVSQAEFRCYQWSSRKKSTSIASKKTASLYILNNTNSGYVIVSGNDKAFPILGYSATGFLDLQNIPPAMQEWLNWKEKEMEYFSNSTLKASNKTTEAWEKIENNLYSAESAMADNEPLIKTLWGQGTYYNELCPVDSGIQSSNKHVPVGCVATAMVQVMKYWEYPVTGNGSHSYIHETYGLQSANFGTAIYDWTSMPIIVNTYNPAVATISYHSGVSVDMHYSPSGSGSNMVNAKNALINYFKYKNTLALYWKSDMASSDWLSMIKNEINNLRPVLLSGSGETGGGHAYICDGYTNDNYFHINWGWNGGSNGYFYFEDLTPGLADYSYYQNATVGIEPSGSSLALYPYTLNIAANNGSSDNIRIVSNSNWTVSCNQSWLNISASSGTGSRSINLTANSENNTGTTRTAIVTVTVSDLSPKSVIISQLPATNVFPNLQPYKPSAWSDKMIISNARNSLSDSLINTSDTVYVNFALSNISSVNITDNFYCWLMLDSIVVSEAPRTGLKSGYFATSMNNIFGRLKEGAHKLKLILDPLNEITESSEIDNTYEKTFTVSNGKPYLYSLVSNLTFYYTRYTRTVSVSSNVKWTVSSDQPWVTSNIINGSNDDKIILTTEENTLPTYRTATITISAPGLEPVIIAVSQVPGLPNLTPYKPSGWLDKIVVSNKINTTIDDIIFNNQTVYIDYSYINAGYKKTAGSFYNRIYLNNILKRSLVRNDTLGANYFSSFRDYSLGTLSAGKYELKFVVDETNSINELNESDNSYSKQFTVYDAATSLMVNPASISFNSLLETKTLEINCVGDWTITNTNNWVTLSVLSGSGNKQITATVSENTGTDLRTGTITITNAVISKTFTINQNGAVTGIGDLTDSGITIYPKPATDKLSISSSNNEILEISVINNKGMVIETKKIAGKEYYLWIQKYPVGYYIINIKTKDRNYRSTFIKQ